MTVYLDLVFFLNFIVDFLLILGTNRLCGQPSRIGRPILAAALGGIYSGACLLPQLGFLGNTLWRMVCLGLMAWIAFGVKGLMRRGCVFVLLSMALGGIALGLGTGGFWSLLAAAGGVVVLCGAGFCDKIGSRHFVPVEICHAGQRLCLTALHDTGNTLCDPLTGKPVLVVGGDTAQRLTGLSVQQLRNPMEAVVSSGIPGLRLIPYKAVGQSSGMLLAMRIREVRIGNRKGSSLVAFSPEGLDGDGGYQALTGGTV